MYQVHAPSLLGKETHKSTIRGNHVIRPCTAFSRSSREVFDSPRLTYSSLNVTIDGRCAVYVCGGLKASQETRCSCVSLGNRLQ